MLLSLMLTAAYTQQGGQRQRMSPEERAKANTEWMTKELKLKDKVTKKVEAINLKYARRVQAEMEKVRQSGDRSGMREVMQELNEEKNEELKPVLGKKNYELYLKKVEERRQNRSQNRPKG